MNTKTSVKFGEGKVSGIISIFLGLMSFCGVFCFKYPEILTTPEFREVYTGESMKILLTGVIIASLFFGVVSFLLSKQKKWALIGIIFCIITIVLGGFEVDARAVKTTRFHLGLDWLLLDLFLMALIFVPIEMVFPKRKDQKTFHEEWRTDLVYFVISHLLVQFFGVITQKPAQVFFGWMGLSEIQAYIQSLPFVVELFLAFFLTDLFQYWTHRFFHRHSFLWRFHSIHHSTENMDWLAGSRTHFVDIFVTRSMAFIPLYVFGFSTITFQVYVIFMAVHAVLIHSNTRINFGFFKYIFATPQYHHWHHCKNPEYYGKNFATIFPFIDKIFGTYYLPNNEWPEDTGLLEADYPKGYLKQAIYPFTKSPFDKDLKMKEYSKR
ncbi:sterol desaturase family protein [Flavobacterium sp. NST-5]|uniref:Sterol desaturase family protein n=1 Tax=Flavobacterium ichthyis TaxID=2698827 RepID=A0ABW9Z666_9FLAO|nr:sterol desaturase family protein [Flavobacterium ichthyis]NBL64337.1 sterol desaturase family protein [Flavobacterium ichthyis]